MIPACASEPLLTGFAEADITPPAGYRKAGGYSEVISTGVHDPLKAKAMVITQGPTSFALVMCDLLSVPEEQSRVIREQFSAASGIPFSETIDYPKLLIGRCVQALKTAHEARKAATLRFGIAEQRDLAFNRRYVMRDGSVKFNPGKANPFIVRPAGPVDTDLPWLLATSDKGEPFGAFTLFAMHTAVFGGSEFGADFPGHLQMALQKHFGGQFISIFGEGCAGDTNHVNTSTKAPDPTPEQIGTKLAETLLSLEKHLKPIQNPQLAIRSETVLAPMKAVSRETFLESQKRLETNTAPFLDLVAAWRVCHAWDIQERHGAKGKPLEIQVIRFDAETALVTLPHEVFVEIGIAIKAASPFRNTMVLSLANDVDYYIPTRRAFEEGSYEVTTCPLDPGCGELLIDTARRLLNEMKP